MFKRLKPGIAILEVILVMAISGLMFAAVVGIYNNRRASAVDDAARQALSEIAKVRNEAQEGYVPQNIADDYRNKDKGFEFVGKYLEIDNNQNQINVHSVFKNNGTGTLSDPLEKIINISENLKAYLASPENTNCSSFISCYRQPASSGYVSPVSSNGKIYVLYSSGNAQQFVFLNDAEFVNFPNPGISNQRDLRLAIAVPGQGVDINQQMANASKKFYIFMPILSTPTLEAK